MFSIGQSFLLTNQISGVNEKWRTEWTIIVTASKSSKQNNQMFINPLKWNENPYLILKILFNYLNLFKVFFNF